MWPLRALTGGLTEDVKRLRADRPFGGSINRFTTEFLTSRASGTPLPQGLPMYAPPADCIVITTPFVPGHRITRVIGATFGLIVRSRGLGRNIVAGFRSLGGGETTEYAQLLEQSRHEAIVRLKDHAKSLGANAAISVGFATSEMCETMTEVLAYGTAVVVEPDPNPAAGVSLR